MKIGILGGTFDPPHIGHLVLARSAWQKLQLDRVLFIPTRIPPHKMEKLTASPEHRFQMVSRALQGELFFEPLRLELERPGPSYTYRTLLDLRGIYPQGTEFYFLAGADCLSDLSSWYRFWDITKLCHFTVISRPEFNIEKKVPGIQRLVLPTPNISSRMVREQLKRGGDASPWLVDSVLNYISENQLYIGTLKPKLKSKK
jgi:nicotinate-nucleotide adenylyltransferase